MLVTALSAFAVNAGNAIINAAMGVALNNMWLWALSFYYVCLSFARGIIILRTRKNVMDKSLTFKDKYRRNLVTYTYTGVFILVVTLALVAMIVLIVRDGNSFEKSGLMIYYFAAYTVYKMIISIVSVTMAHKRGDLGQCAARNMNLVDAAVSVLALQTALLTRFSLGTFINWANAITGGIVCGFVIILGLYMVIRSRMYYKRLRPAIDGN